MKVSSALPGIRPVSGGHRGDLRQRARGRRSVARFRKRCAGDRGPLTTRARGRQRSLRGAPFGGIAQAVEELLPLAWRRSRRPSRTSVGLAQRERRFRERFRLAAQIADHALERAAALRALSVRAVSNRGLRRVVFSEIVLVAVVLDLAVLLLRRAGVGSRWTWPHSLSVRPAVALARCLGHRAPPLSER